MAPDQRAEYARVLGIMEAVNRELLMKGSMKFLGAMLWTGLDYPDKPFGWGHDPEVKKALAEAHEGIKSLCFSDQSFLSHFNHAVRRPRPIACPPSKDGEGDPTSSR